jgi:hypothetical protein
MSDAARNDNPGIPPLVTGDLLAFVLLRHTGHGDEHYDLMVQIPSQERLLTWRLTAPPQSVPAPAAIRIQDHRAIYLTYEGPISGNRGKVERIMGGNATLLRQSAPPAAALRFRLPTDPPCEITLPLAATDD